MEMKGFVFSLDALLAISIVLIIFIALTFSLIKGQEDYLTKAMITKYTNDIIIILDQNETLDTFNETYIKEELTKIVPNSLCAMINMTSYEYKNKEFELDETVEIFLCEESFDNNQDIFIAKRGFLTFEDNRIDKYNLATIKVWLK